MPIASNNPQKSPLRLICVGTGRDGTVSLAHMVQSLLDQGGGGSVMHEYCSREFHHAHTSFVETKDPKWQNEISALIEACPYDCIVGNGYAAILPLFLEHFGSKLTLVHLRRRNRTAAVESLTKNCELFPAAWGYYSDDLAALNVKRLCAFHVGEITKDAWIKLPLKAKMGWYYDNTHALIDAKCKSFARCYEFATEELDDVGTRETIAQLVLGHNSILPTPKHLNAHVDYGWLDPDQRLKLQWLLGRLDLYKLANDDTYALEFFTNSFIAWSGYQITRAPQITVACHKTPEESTQTLTKVEGILTACLRDVQALKAQLLS